MIVIIYAVVSNHCHVAVLAVSQRDADAFGQEIKKLYAMWFNRKYGGKATLRGVDVKAILLDNDWYVRNALAYIPRNALDNGCSINNYRWSGYRAMFAPEDLQPNTRAVASLSKRERESILHTGDNLVDVKWLIDDNSPRVMLPDSEYLKQVNEICLRWFQAEISTISFERKVRLIPYLFRTTHTTVPQLARVTGLQREMIARIIRKPTSGEGHI